LRRLVRPPFAKFTGDEGHPTVASRSPHVLPTAAVPSPFVDLPLYMTYGIGGTNAVRGWPIGARDGKHQWLNTMRCRPLGSAEFLTLSSSGAFLVNCGWPKWHLNMFWPRLAR
jgi:hypothetical protein